MSQYILRRLLLLPVLLFGITILDFVFISVAPGDPVSAMLDPEIMMQMSPEQIAARRQALGLDQPILVRYVAWLREVSLGNLGYSIIRGRSVAELMVEAWQNTALLIAISMVVSVVTGVILGILSALRPYSKMDYVLTLLSFVGAALPGFILAMGLIYVGALKLGWFPTSGLSAPTPAVNPLLDRIHHMILPVLALSFGGWASYLRYTRSSMLEVLSMDFITTARAKGLAERIVLLRHAFKNAMLPLITILGLSLPGLFGGAFIVEVMFNIPGMGSLLVDSTAKRDYPMMMGGLLLSAVLVLFANLLADIAYAFVDPRIRYE
jgi:peptide/nickel transport system permease protein